MGEVCGTARVLPPTWSDRIAAVVTVGIAALLVFGPLSFGAVQPGSQLVLQLGSVLLFLLWAIGQALDATLVWHKNLLLAPMAAFAVVVAAQLLFRTTAYPYVTTQTLTQLVPCGLLFFTASQGCRTIASLKLLAVSLVTLGVALALFAMVQDWTFNGKLYWYFPVRSNAWVYGPYVNHNHFAGLMEMLFPIALVMASVDFICRRKRIVLATAAVVIAGAIFTSRSLGGMVGFVAGLVFVLIVMGRKRERRTKALAIVLGCVVLAAYLLLLQQPGLMQRLGMLGHLSGSDGAAEGRLQIVRDSIPMYRQRPFLGWGLGAFPVAFPRFKTFYTNFVINQAHNDWLQALVEMGIIGFIPVCCFAVMLYWIALRRLRHWKSDPFAAAAFAGLTGCTAILVHSLADFNLRIPANAALFFVMAALATTERNSARVSGDWQSDAQLRINPATVKRARKAAPPYFRQD